MGKTLASSDPASGQNKQTNPDSPSPFTAALVLEDGTIIRGQGLGAPGSVVGEVCFNTGMTGYQESISDPSYAGQILTFTFPHIGNVGTNNDDIEAIKPFLKGVILRQPITEASNYRAISNLGEWLTSHGIPGISNVDTRMITQLIRDKGAPKGTLIHSPSGDLDLSKALDQTISWSGLEGMDLAKEVSVKEPYRWNDKLWGTILKNNKGVNYKVIVIDYGVKHNILRSLNSLGCEITVVPASSSAKYILSLKPDGIFLSNGPGDPAATGVYAVPTILKILEKEIPLMGICLGHQLLCLALGAKTTKMHLGHRGSNHPVKDIKTGKVEITSQNHGFVVDSSTLPSTAEITHISLFDNSLEGIQIKNKSAFSVQYHPEASPGPQDSNYLFKRFIQMMERKI